MTLSFASYPSLRDRVVFISGGATGIGAELVRQFAEQGARTAFVDVDDAAAEALASDVANAGLNRPLYRRCDVRDIEALQRVLSDVAQALGQITVLVNNAADDTRCSLDDVTLESWENSLNVNLRHHVFAIQAVAPMMREAGGGSIVNLGSISWHVRDDNIVGYGTAKAGIEGQTRYLARALGRDAIRVNCVVPGWILTDRQRRLWLTPEAKEEALRLQCLSELLMPDDVARLVLWLAADDSRLCTGQSWVIDGGRS
jgi:D-xylose 1-dehydrogenase